MATVSGFPGHPAAENEKEQVLEQLQNLLSNQVFRNSQRYPALLRYVVEQTLAGNSDQLKERTLGIAVFHRSPDYDTNADPVVRISAGEVRKRLAQYYQEHPGELRIDLPSGSYIPHFHLTALPELLPETHAPSLPIQPPPAELSPDTQKPHRAKLRVGAWWVLCAVVLLLGAAVAVPFMRSENTDALTRRFWAPLIQSRGPLLFVLGDHLVPLADLGKLAQAFATPMAEQTGKTAQTMPPLSMLPVGDALAFARVTALLGTQGIAFDAQSETRTSLDDLRSHPAVLFGAFNNQWSLHATRNLRFRFQREYRPDGSQVVSIVDTTAKTPRQWSIVWSQPLEVKTSDYAIVARFFDPENEREVVLIAGLGENGTVAASEFVTESHYLTQLNAFAPAGGWARRNLETVIETPVVNGLSGPPHVEAAWFW